MGINPEGLLYESNATTVTILSTYLIELFVIIIIVARYTTILIPIINSKRIEVPSLCVMFFGLLAGGITLGNPMYGLAFLTIGGICTRAES